MSNNTRICYLGSSKFSVFCLEELKTLGILPALIITTPDMPTGRGLKLTATPVKTWALENNISCLSPDKLDSDFTTKLSTYNSSLFLVASYGKIIPKAILELPKMGTLNIHPSLLPKYRGASPLQAQILNNEKEVGVTIILLDEKMDHGPIIASQDLSLALEGETLTTSWPVKFNKLEKTTALIGAKLFAKILPDWMDSKIIPIEQDHDRATFTKKVKKEDGLIDIETGDQHKNYLKFLAYSDWPNVYFFVSKNNQKIRVLVKDAEYANNQFIIKRVLPEGKKEMNYQDFLRGIK